MKSGVLLKIPLSPPFWLLLIGSQTTALWLVKGGILVPLFYKEGLGEIFPGLVTDYNLIILIIKVYHTLGIKQWPFSKNKKALASSRNAGLEAFP